MMLGTDLDLHNYVRYSLTNITMCSLQAYALTKVCNYD